jgi:hypothetical protein
MTATTQHHGPASRSAVTPPLTSRDVRAPETNRAGRYVETAEYIAAARRFLEAARRRVGDGMDIENLRALDDLARYAGTLVYDSANTLHDGTPAAPGHSWAEIGRALGVTGQTAWRRFGPLRTDPRAAAAARPARAAAAAARTRAYRQSATQEA